MALRGHFIKMDMKNIMRKTLYIFLAFVVLVSCRQAPVLPRDNWNGTVYSTLCGLISGYGSSSADYDPDCRPYAVFDFDNTTVMNDISSTMMVYLIENLKFTFTPENASRILSTGIDNLDTVVSGYDMTAREFVQDIARDYEVIYGKMRSGASFDEIHELQEYKDFRARIWAMSFGVEYTFGYDVWFQWMPALLDGLDGSQVQELTRESVDYWMAEGRIWEEEWNSSDGKISVSVPKGLVLPEESLHLYKTLKDNGFDVYICSASFEVVVEAMACDPKYGLGLDPDHVFGIRFAEEGGIRGGIAPDYDQPASEGKTRCIKRFMAPSHGGNGPALVAGDSNGDYSMLTSFPDLKVGLIINCHRSGNIARLSEKALEQTDADSPRYVLQGRDTSLPGYVRSSGVAD